MLQRILKPVGVIAAIVFLLFLGLVIAADHASPAYAAGGGKPKSNSLYNDVVNEAPAPAAKSWTGCYAGVHVGAAIMNTKVDANVGPTSLASVDGLAGSGAVGGLGAGCDVQLPGTRLVLGAFGDYSWFRDAEFTVTLGGPTGFVGTMNPDREWAIGGRFGYLTTPSTLFYVLAAYSQLEMDDLSAKFGGVTVGTLALPTFKGYQLGAGIETVLARNINLKVEYRHSHYDAESVPLFGPLALNFEPNIHTVRLGLSYKFDFDRGAAAPAK